MKPMRIAMFTNVYAPLVGGIRESIERFRINLTQRGHDVMIVAPRFDEEHPEKNTQRHVVRVPSITNIFDRYSFPVAYATDLGQTIDNFEPDVIHTHHPFLLGDTALRVAFSRKLPIVVTHHTSRDQYLHHMPDQPEWIRDYLVNLYTGHANLCDAVVAPSTSIARELEEEGVIKPIRVIPTGVDLEAYAEADGARFRDLLGIDAATPLIGHVGRLAPEKNLAFLARAVAEFLHGRSGARFVVVGSGEEERMIWDEFNRRKLGDQISFTGTLQGRELRDAYAAMDLFVFASKTETQGLVLLEALAGNTPVVCLDGPGVRDLMENADCGLLVREENVNAFSNAMQAVWSNKAGYAAAAQQHVRAFSQTESTTKLLELYYEVIESKGQADEDVHQHPSWHELLFAELEIWENRLKSLVDVVSS